MQNNIIIPVANPLTGDLTISTPLVFPSYFGGGNNNLDVTAYGNSIWPLACDDPSTPASCEQGDPQGTTPGLGLWTVGQQYPTSDLDPARRIWVEDKNGIDKTDEVSGTTFGVIIDAPTGAPDEMWVAASVGPWGIGDIIHTPQGTDITNSWNSYFPDNGHLAGSGAMDIVVQEDWLYNIDDTHPVLININEIVAVIDDTTDSVKIVLKIPSQAGGAYFTKITLAMDIAASNSFLLVECINRAIKEAAQQPHSNPVVDWKYTYNLGMGVKSYSLEML